MSCDQRVALVTGSGQGIGRGVAIGLARDGYLVILNSRSADPNNPNVGAYEVKNVIETDGGAADVIRGDVGHLEDHEQIETVIAEKYGRLDLLVNNAGVAPAVRADILEATPESYDRVMGINLRGPYFLTQRLARRMIEWKQDGAMETGRICFITSISAYTASISRGEYCISKAGLSMATLLFADRLAEYDMPVIEIRPGIIATPMTAGVKGKYDKLIAEGLLPNRRWGTPDDVARAVCAVGRGDFDYSTGEQIDVSGGFNIRRL